MDGCGHHGGPFSFFNLVSSFSLVEDWSPAFLWWKKGNVDETETGLTSSEPMHYRSGHEMIDRQQEAATLHYSLLPCMHYLYLVFSPTSTAASSIQASTSDRFRIQLTTPESKLSL
jgi:hypothetical protein